MSQLCYVCSGGGQVLENVPKACGGCHGSGRSYDGTYGCTSCGGSGRSNAHEHVTCRGCGGRGHIG